MSSIPNFARRSHRPKAFNFLNIPEEVKAQRTAMLEAKRLSYEAVQAKEETANAMAALEAEENRKVEISRQLAEAKQREASIAEALQAAHAVTAPLARIRATKKTD